MATVIEHAEGHYETHVMPYGQAYVWYPECVVVGCDCGEMAILTVSETVCGCGVDHGALVRELTASHSPRHGDTHPWDREYRAWQDEFLRTEHPHRRGTQAVDRR
ncbi:MAG TPA: hypothetical protein VFY59_06945 [Rubrobacter sp.]|nr:hypothetical protein [Rubrobacter sp.]